MFLNSPPPSPPPVPICLSTCNEATSQPGEIVIAMNVRKLVLSPSSLFSWKWPHYSSQVRGKWWSCLQSIAKEVGTRRLFLAVWNVFIVAYFLLTDTLCQQTRHSGHHPWLYMHPLSWFFPHHNLLAIHKGKSQDYLGRSQQTEKWYKNEKGKYTHELGSHANFDSYTDVVIPKFEQTNNSAWSN